ncbi:MAG: phytanoyl-CoA dioxygenase family protein [Acidimicrobiales bacterium]
MDDERFGPIDFDLFHREQLPALLRTRGPVFSDDDAAVVRPLAFQLTDGRGYTYLPSPPTFSVEAGTGSAQTVVELSADQWCSFVWELQSCFALLYADRLAVTRGSFGQLARWEPSLRVAFSGQALYDLDDPTPVRDAMGRELDCTRRFTLDDSDDEITDFLRRAGFVHLEGVMGVDEVEALRADVAAAVAAARPDDRRSWWTIVDGVEVCHRVNYLNDGSARIGDLGSDARFLRIASLGGPDLRDARDRLDGNGVVIKVPGATGGLADLPWHRDCGMGGHPVKCPMINVGIQLDRATAASGQLLVIPGSHQGTSRLPSAHEAAGLPVAALTTEPGDVTVHFGHTLHSAPPPNDLRAPGRRALYLSFVPPLTFEMVGPGQGYNDVLFTRDGGRVKHVDQLR